MAGKVDQGSAQSLPGCAATPATSGAEPSALAALLARVEAAEGPDRELDAEIAVAFSGDPDAWVVNPSPHSIFAPAPGWWRDAGDKSHSAPEVTASLDAALALCERGLPGWAWNISGPDPEGCNERLSYAELAGEVRMVKWGWDEPPEPNRDTYGAHAKTPSLAILAALLKAKIAEAASPASAQLKAPADQ